MHRNIRLPCTSIANAQSYNAFSCQRHAYYVVIIVSENHLTVNECVGCVINYLPCDNYCRLCRNNSSSQNSCRVVATVETIVPYCY